MSAPKLVHSLILDAGPIIKNEPSISALIACSHEIVTLPSVVNEIRDVAARSRLETTLQPFLTLREPTPSSVKVVQDFSRKTGDLSVLSKVDVQLLGLAYEIECERNGGDWRLRRVPGQKRVNGPPPERAENSEPDQEQTQKEPREFAFSNVTDALNEAPPDQKEDKSADETIAHPLDTVKALESAVMNTHIDNRAPEAQETSTEPQPDSAAVGEGELHDADASTASDSDGWITPSNIHKYEARDAANTTSAQAAELPTKLLQVATVTTDFAMQNVLLMMNLNLLSPALHRISHLKTHIKRCHACFQQVKDMEKQFCPRCGKDTLTKVACSTTQDGEFRLHLKRNMQWNNRGNKYTLPKPATGSSSGKVIQGGGKGGWGNELIFAEDQKEYTRAVREEKKAKMTDLMDEDFLPALLTGSGKSRFVAGKPKVGAGRDVNSRRRR